jgi:hypothetical protein
MEAPKKEGENDTYGIPLRGRNIETENTIQRAGVIPATNNEYKVSDCTRTVQ